MLHLFREKKKLKDGEKSREQLEKELSELRKKLQETEALCREKQQAVAYLSSFKKTIDTMQIGVTITDLEGNFVYVNPADLEMHGYLDDELRGKKARIFAPEAKRRPMTAGEIVTMKRWKRETVNKRKDGTIFPVQLMSDVIRGSNGEPVGIVTTCEDIRERKKMENEIRERIEELEVFYEASVNRELKMDELKREIKELKNELMMYKKNGNDRGSLAGDR